MPPTTRPPRNSGNSRTPISPPQMYYCMIPSPIGHLLLVGNGQSLSGLFFQDGKNPDSPQSHWIQDPEQFSEVIQQLGEYFSGTRTTFSLPLSPIGTPFQHRVWKALRKIPYGHTRSYGDIARSIKHPNASRAVGSANGKNPISIIVPCHRVIGQSGKLVGYGGGIPIKEYLLAHERQISQNLPQGPLVTGYQGFAQAESSRPTHTSF